MITFEHPLNERIRTFLRLEHLFKQLDYCIHQEDPRGSRSAIATLLDIVAVTARADVRNELLKELDRHISSLDRLSSQRGVDQAALTEVMDDLRRASDAIHVLNGPIGHMAREDEFLKAIAQRSSIPGGTCSFDLPHFHYWVIQDAELRQARFTEWLEDLKPAIEAIQLALSLVRSSSASRQVSAEGGFYQEALDSLAPAQMVRVAVAADQNIFPEISGHKNRFSIRFMNAAARGRATQHFDDVDFKLTCCVF
ncbi:cell division protein ZapD [Thiorhodococcus mannitoliphagus]|uniref:Cell division protein ZapD n=1 Tax=Thiorhodococcus mannitoliphagus TaxID=329406 RepID=A0A6P1DQE1_9GAMM|nr:cell division protein ZapD [Thiorhodococcus mannitoliphagus]NEX18886.1 cell division protein ZapD [Thiorhodococcus mannitoliphagus]